MKAVVFDMDGTMVDNMMIHHKAWQKKLKEYGLPLSLEEVKENIHGVNHEILERLFGDRFSPEERIKISGEKEAAYREIFAEDLKLIHGLQEFLENLKSSDIKMGVASAAPVENVDFVLDGLGLRSYFHAMLHAGDVSKGKPDPEIFLKACRQLGVDPSNCVVFEDSPTGALSGVNAGCPVVVITTTHNPDEFSHIKGIKTFIKDFSGLNQDFIQNL